MEDMLRVGVITSPHGVRGEVKVFPTTDDPSRFKHLKKVVLKTGRETIPLTISSVKFFKNLVIVKFKEYNNINEIERFRQAELLITRDQAIPLEEDEYFIADLIGLSVVTDEGAPLGTLKDVMETGANDVYIVETPEKKELLLPAIGDCIKEVDLANGQMTVHLMDGLLDL